MIAMRPTVIGFFAAAVLCVVYVKDASAQAKPKPAPPAKSGAVYEISQIIITARPTRPSAVVELGKILPEIEIGKIRQPFLTKIEEAVAVEPF